jgi:predicted nucleic acid-binding protein
MSMLRIIIDTETLMAGLAYPATPPGRIISAWRHGALELVLHPNILNRLIDSMTLLGQDYGWSAYQVSEMVSAMTLNAIVLAPEEGFERIPSEDETDIRYRLPRGAAYFVTNDVSHLAKADCYPVLTPGDFWGRFA